MSRPLELTNITTASTDNFIPVPIYGIPGALKASFNPVGDSFQHPSLFPNACPQDGGSHNCTISCADPRSIFQSLDTLHNCVVWSRIYANAENPGLSEPAADLASTLGYVDGPGNASLPSEISNRIQTCLVDTCDSECRRNANRRYGAAALPSTFPTNLTGNEYVGMNESFRSYFDPCQYMPARANADVAGIGVFISYAMQIGLILIAFVLALPWKNFMTGIRNAFRRWRSRSNKYMTSSKAEVINSSKSEDVQKDTKRTIVFDPASAIVPALVEFQKAQCYFMLATNIAGLIVQTRGGVSGDSMREIYNTYVFIKVVAIGGYLPVTFGMLTLRMLNKIGWYLIGLSVTSIGVSMGNLYKKRTFDPSQDDLNAIRDQALQGIGPDSCGGVDLSAWCLSRLSFKDQGFRGTNEGSGADGILAYCLVIMVVLVFEHFWNSKDPTNRKVRDFAIRRRRIDLSQIISKPNDWLRRLSLWTYIIPTIFTVAVAIYIYCFVIFINDLDWFREHRIYDPDWGFGQIVAILAWAPPLCEYLWGSFRGPEKGSDYRIPENCEVRKKDP